MPKKMTNTGMRIAARIVAETPQPAEAGEELERKACPAAQKKIRLHKVNAETRLKITLPN